QACSNSWESIARGHLAGRRRPLDSVRSNNSASCETAKGIIVERTKSKKQCTIVSWLVQRRWRTLLCALAVACLSMPSPALAKSLNGTLLGQGTGREVAFNHHGKPLNDWAGTLKFKLDSGEDLLVFCIQIDVRVRSGDRYRSDGPVLGLPNGCQIRYLLDA